jgi:hypothetical protein
MMRGEKVRPAGNLAEGLLAAIDPARGSPRASQIGVNVNRNVEDLLHRALAQKPLERPRDAGVFWSAMKELVKQSHMAATVLDANVMDAMDRVRAAQAQKPPQTQPGPFSQAPQQTPRGGIAAPKFAGTLLLANSPLSAAPMPAPTPKPDTAPMRGAPQQAPGATSTAPLAPVLRPPAALGPQPSHVPQPPHTSQGSHASVAPPRSVPRPATAKSSSALFRASLVFFAIVFVGVGALGAYWYLRLR